MSPIQARAPRRREQESGDAKGGRGRTDTPPPRATIRRETLHSIRTRLACCCLLGSLAQREKARSSLRRWQVGITRGASSCYLEEWLARPLNRIFGTQYN
jgi:hypothetical protein